MNLLNNWMPIYPVTFINSWLITKCQIVLLIYGHLTARPYDYLTMWSNKLADFVVHPPPEIFCHLKNLLVTSCNYDYQRNPLQKRMYQNCGLVLQTFDFLWIYFYNHCYGGCQETDLWVWTDTTKQLKAKFNDFTLGIL